MIQILRAVPMMLMDSDGHLMTLHGGDFTAAGSQQDLDSLNLTMENNFRT